SKYHVWDIVPDSMKEKVRSEIYPSMMQKGFWEGEQQYQNIKTGKLIDVHLMTFTIRDPDTGAPMYYANVSLDITEIKKANKAVVKEKKTVDYILESLPGMFYMFDSKGRFVRWNKNFETITGHSGDEILKISPLENIIDKDKDRVSNAINNAFSKGYDEVEAVIVTKDGKKIPFFFSAYRKIIDNTPYILGMGLDITKTKEAEKEIAKLALIVQHSGEFIALADKDGKATFINEAGAKLVGIEQNDISKYKMGDLFASDIKEKLNAEVIPAITKKGSWEGDLQYINLKTGVPVDVHTMSFSIKDPETKEPLYLANVSLDITARKRAEEALAREKANVEYILDSLPGMFYMFYMIDEKGQFVRWNKNLETLTGYSAEEVLKMKPLEFIDIRYKDLVNESLSKAFSEGYADMEANIVTKDGKRIPFFFSANKQIIDNTPYILGMGLDITTTKDAEKEIAKLAAIVQNSGEFIALADNEGQLTFINEAGAKMVGINRNNISMYKIVDVLPNDQQEKLNSEILPTLKEKGFWKGDLRYRNINTEKLTDVHAMTFTITDPDTDKTLYLANVSLNITDRKNAEAALKEVNKKLNLLGSITRHDILNQVTGAQGYMEILEMDGALPPNSKIEKYCSKIQGAIETIKRQILFTKDYKDLGEQSPEWYNVKDIINNNYKNLGFKEIKLINETENLEVYADPLFEKVIYNLFDNAVKHGDKITIINFYFKESEDHLDLICEDDGVGIPEEYKEKIFKREYYKNTGLGLFLSREILSITGLSIEETGEFGKGAKFVIHIPKEMFRFGEL
ncbi:MAG: PAS domain-containing sensor histidine kinase, partial [Methanomicrobiaceae archaeon]|nr:PAS domain-containing sensor histidine kinase [Methanomicrobiaceae archaeon]